MKLLSKAFDNTLTETFKWATDVHVSTDGTEQRIMTLDPPRRTLAVNYQFTQLADVQAIMRTMFGMSSGLLVPHWHQSTKISPAAIGANAIGLASIRTELRDGCQALIYDPRSEAFELVSIVHVTAGQATLAAGLVNAWKAGARVAPVWPMAQGDNAVITRGRVNEISNAGFSLTQLSFCDPFLNPLNTTVLTSFSGLPVIVSQPAGDDFSESINNGATLVDYGAAVEIRSPWKHAQNVFARDFPVQRIFNRPQWLAWLAFMDYCKGSLNPFFVPTMRPDFNPIAQDATHLTLDGSDYVQEYFPFSPFKQFAVYDATGASHLVSATAAIASGQNSLVTINPALPDGFVVAKVSLLLKCRIADDIVSIAHSALASTVTLNMRTVDE